MRQFPSGTETTVRRHPRALHFFAKYTKEAIYSGGLSSAAKYGPQLVETDEPPLRQLVGRM